MSSLSEEVGLFCDAAIRYCAARGEATGAPADELRSVAERGFLAFGDVAWRSAIRGLLSHPLAPVRLCSAELLLRSASGSGAAGEPAALRELEELQRGEDAHLRLLAMSALWFSGHRPEGEGVAAAAGGALEAADGTRNEESAISPSARRAHVYRFETQYLIHALSLSARGLWVMSRPVFLLQAVEDPAELGRCVELALQGSEQGIPHPEDPDELVDPVASLQVDWDELGAPTACVEVECQDGGRILLTPTRRLSGEGGFEPLPATRLETGAVDAERLAALVLQAFASCEVLTA